MQYELGGMERKWKNRWDETMQQARLFHTSFCLLRPQIHRPLDQILTILYIEHTSNSAMFVCEKVMYSPDKIREGVFLCIPQILHTIVLLLELN